MSLHDSAIASPLFGSSPALRKKSSISLGRGPPSQCFMDLHRSTHSCRNSSVRASFLGPDDEERNAVFWRTADKELAAQNKELAAHKSGRLYLQV